jgi:hypothetical protein
MIPIKIFYIITGQVINEIYTDDNIKEPHG